MFQVFYLRGVAFVLVFQTEFHASLVRLLSTEWEIAGPLSARWLEKLRKWRYTRSQYRVSTPQHWNRPV